MTIFAISSRTDWYLTRGSGAVSLLLLTAIVVLGTLSPMRVQGSRRWPRFAIGALHRDLSLLALAVLAVHIVTSVLDTYAPIGWLDAVIPLHSSYRPLWLGLGALAFDLLLALVITSLVRRRLGYERWRGVHWFAYACWPVAVLHGLGTGSDANSAWLLWITVVCVFVTVVAVALRITRAGTPTSRARPGWLALALATPVGIAAFALIGPLQSGWAAKAGTPSNDLHAAAPAAATTSVRRPSRAFSDTMRGSLIRSRVPGGTIIDLALSLNGSVPGRLRVRLAGTPIHDGGIALVGSQVDLNAPALGMVSGGTVLSLSGDSFRARVEQSNGVVYELAAALDIAPRADAVTGRLNVTPVVR